MIGSIAGDILFFSGIFCRWQRRKIFRKFEFFKNETVVFHADDAVPLPFVHVEVVVAVESRNSVVGVDAGRFIMESLCISRGMAGFLGIQPFIIHVGCPGNRIFDKLKK